MRTRRMQASANTAPTAHEALACLAGLYAVEKERSSMRPEPGPEELHREMIRPKGETIRNTRASHLPSVRVSAYQG